MHRELPRRDKAPAGVIWIHDPARASSAARPLRRVAITTKVRTARAWPGICDHSQSSGRAHRPLASGSLDRQSLKQQRQGASHLRCREGESVLKHHVTSRASCSSARRGQQIGVYRGSASYGRHCEPTRDSVRSSRHGRLSENSITFGSGLDLEHVTMGKAAPRDCLTRLFSGVGADASDWENDRAVGDTKDV